MMSTIIQAVSFDASNTVMAPHPSVGTVYAEALAGVGITAEPEALERAFKHAFKSWKRDFPNRIINQQAWRELVQRTLHDHCPPDQLEGVFLTLWAAFAEGRRWRILPGVWETLQKLSAARLRLVLLSNNDGRLHNVCRDLGLSRYFEQVFVSEELGAEKPSRAVFDAVAQALNLPPQALLHVGDTPHEDAAGALAAGWHAAHLGHKADAPEGAFAIASLPELCDILLPHR